MLKKIIKLLLTINVFMYSILSIYAHYTNADNLTKDKEIIKNNQIIFPKSPQRIYLYDVGILHDESKWTINNVHDPSIIKANAWYYVYSTDVKVGGTPRPGIQIRKSKDLINWKWVGYVFNNKNFILNGVPQKAYEWTQAINLWAPDIKMMNGNYYLYYAASQFGKNQSYIGLATSSNPEGPWKDEGEVIKTKQGDVPNAIDPCLTFDANGNPWLVYGSFFGGIYILKIDKKTGKPAEKGFGTLIAKRSRVVNGAVEGPYIIYSKKFKKYYLFVSYDSLFRDYNVRVARAEKITGPYKDYNGNIMTDTVLPPNDVGTKILGGYKFQNDDGWLAPGHNSILEDNDKYFIVHHARGAIDSNWPYLHIRRILWTDDGWPVVSPERYAGEYEQKLTKELIVGSWERIILDPSFNYQSESELITLLKNGKINKETSKDYWVFSEPNTLKLYWFNKEENSYNTEIVKVMPSWDWEKWKTTLIFSGLNNKGLSVWGKKVK